MKHNYSYYHKIKGFIIILSILTQAFLFCTCTASYFYTKVNAQNDMAEEQRSFYKKALETLTVQIDNVLYEFEMSGALNFCSTVYRYEPYSQAEAKYNAVIEHIENSGLNDRYISGFYLISNIASKYPIVNINQEFSALGKLSLEYSSFFKEFQQNQFIANYEAPYLFRKEDLSDLAVSPAIQDDYNQMLDTLDNRVIYFTFREDILCILVINPEFWDNSFNDLSMSGSSIVLKNKLGNVFYSKFYGADSSEYHTTGKLKNELTDQTNFAYMQMSTHFNLNGTDIIFVAIMLIISVASLLWAIKISDKYTTKIIEPYYILKNFFSMNAANTKMDEFDFIRYENSCRRRSNISKNIVNAVIYAVILPNVLSTVVFMTTFYLSSQQYAEQKMDTTHAHLIEEFKNSFDLFLYSQKNDKANKLEDASRLSYTVTLDETYSLLRQPFEALEYQSFSDFNKQIKPARSLTGQNILVNIPADLFGEHAVGLLTKGVNDTHNLKVVKLDQISNVVCDDTINFMLLDETEHIITQNTFIKQSEKQKIIQKPYGMMVKTFNFSDFGWTLYTFSENSTIKSAIYYTLLVDCVLLILFLLIVIIFAWLYSIQFIRPLELIMSSMSNDDTAHIKKDYHMPEDSEIGEVLRLYNQMIKQIKKLTSEKIKLQHEEETLRLLNLRSELNALQQQINPHFLYNTFEAINLRVIKSRDFDTSRMINKLSKIFRYAISSANETAFMYEEIENTKNYLSIWDVRFPGRYRFSFEINPDTEGISILKLTLQPIVENCFFHAFDKMEDHCIIKIKTELAENFVVITVEDNGQGMTPEALETLQAKMKKVDLELRGKGIGICNVCQRLKLFYGESAVMEIDSQLGIGTVVRIKFNLNDI